MLKAIIMRNGVMTHAGERPSLDELNVWIQQNEANHAWGRPESWYPMLPDKEKDGDGKDVRILYEGKEITVPVEDVLETEEKSNEVVGTSKSAHIKAEYIITIVDLDTDPEYLELKRTAKITALEDAAENTFSKIHRPMEWLAAATGQLPKEQVDILLADLAGIDAQVKAIVPQILAARSVSELDQIAISIE